MHAAFGAALQDDLALVGIAAFDLRNIGQLKNVKPLGDAWPHLRGVAVDGLLAGEYNVLIAIDLFDLADRLRQRVGRRQSVRAGERTVGQQYRAVGADGEGFAQRFRRHWWPHRQNCHFSAKLVANLQRLFQREEVIRVDDGRHALAHDRVGHRMNPDLRAVGHLLDAH